jgi:hypothetical protein
MKLDSEDAIGICRGKSMLNRKFIVNVKFVISDRLVANVRLVVKIIPDP